MKKLYAYVIFFVLFLIFPLGQLLRMEVVYFGKTFTVHVIDIVSAFSLPFILLTKGDRISGILKTLIFIIISSFVFSALIFNPGEMLSGLLYLIRLVSYFAFYLLVFFLSESQKSKTILLKTMFYSIFAFMILGIIQYIYFYDLRDLIYMGWDDHYYRFTSTLLDPGFAASELIIGLIILLRSEIVKQKLLKYLSVSIFILSIALTYSRAGYLSLIAVCFYIFAKKRRLLFWLSILFMLVILLLPKPKSSGVELARTFSIISRINNYENTLKIYTSYPLFGIGFNNICQYKTSYSKSDNYFSHSCSGSDSSIFLLLATTGTVGTIVFINCLYNVGRYLKNDPYEILLKTVFLSIIVGSFFNNLLFYNFCMALLSVSFGLTRKISIPDKKLTAF